MKNNILIPALGAAVILVVVAVLFSRGQNLKTQLEQANQMTQQMQDEVKRLQAEKAKAQQENEKLHADAVSYLALNSQLQDEKDSLQKRLSESQKSIEQKDSELQKSRQKLDEMEKSINLEKSQTQGKLSQEKAALEKKIATMESSLAKERGVYHYNLGVAYAQAKLYEEATEAYEKAINFDPDNAEAHYNLAVLYENMKDDPDRAVEHYKRYLEIKPEAEDRDQVEALIKKLE